MAKEHIPRPSPKDMKEKEEIHEHTYYGAGGSETKVYHKIKQREGVIPALLEKRKRRMSRSRSRRRR